MAQENIKKFFEEVSKNTDLRKQLNEATKTYAAEIAKAVKAQAETVASVAKKAGFDFTAEDFLSAGAPEDSKLDMSELDAVAGGRDYVDFADWLGGAEKVEALDTWTYKFLYAFYRGSTGNKS